MRYLLTFAVVCLAGLGFCRPGVAANGDEIRAELEKAKKEFAAADDNARTALVTAFDETIKSVAKTGNLDAVKQLKIDKLAFEEGGRVPLSVRMRTPAIDY